GGFSEWSVVEDLHTSIRIHAAGWRSVFHPRPVSVGLAPKTAAEYARQRLRWSIDSLRILRFDPPWRRKELTLRAKLHYSHTLLSYLVVMVQLGFLLGPPAWILGRLTLLHDADWQAQLLHVGPWLGAVVIMLVRWAGVRGAVRSLRLTTAFLPLVFWAALWGLVSQSAGRGGVTRKADLPRFNGLVFAGLALPLGLVGVMVWGVLDDRAGGSDLAMVWAAILASVAIGPLVKFGSSRIWSALWQVVVVGTAATLAAGSVAVTRFAWEAPGGLYQAFQPVDGSLREAQILTNELGSTVVVGPPIPAPAAATDTDTGADDDVVPVPTRVSLAADDGIYVGYTSDALPHDLGDIEVWADEVTSPQIVHWYQQWGTGDSRFRGDWMAEVAAQGGVPMVSWEAWAKPEGGFNLAEQELGRMADIAAGDYDDYIDEWAEAAADYGDPILLRPFHEMNGTWYPWSVGVNGNTEDDFIAGWRHLVDRFRLAEADNVSFVWSINTLASYDEGRGVEAYYPGDDYVDWVATSGFNWDDYQPEWSSWVTPQWVFAETYRLLASFDKPVMFAEIGTGTNGGDGVEWVEEAMTWFETLPQLGAIVWFDRSYDGGITFELTPGQQDAFARAVAEGDRFAPDLVVQEHPILEAGSAAPVPPLLSEIEPVDDAGIVPGVEGVVDDDGS
ncbi:MAG: glycosyl hydrolase, partial [Actinomycetota bacterium]